jgi:hypothetical protein
MGTRADFYIGRGETAEWVGSIAWDGYPDGIDAPVIEATTPDGFRNALANFAATRDDWTAPEMGWPWPWKTSSTTDYAYALDEGKVWASGYGGTWFDASQPETDIEDARDADRKAVFPDMSGKMATTLGRRSGLIVLGF